MTNGTRGLQSALPGYETYPHLFSEGRFGRLTLRNRIIMAPMGTGFATPDGRVTDRHLHYYAERALGGVGMVITEVVGVEGDIDPTPAGNLLRLDSDLQIAGFSDLARVIHDHGAAACIQLTPGFGRQGQAPPGRALVSSSDIPSFTDPKTTARGLSREEIARLVQAFGEAARRAASAGFDAIEIHGHTGYLVDQFLSPLWNTRTDEYGGSLDNRVRFAVELIRSVRERLGPDFPVSFRFSADLKVPGDRPLEEARAIGCRLVEAGATALHVDAGCYEAMPWIFPPLYFGRGPLVTLAAAVKEVVDVPVIAVGNIFEPALADQVLADGQCDFVASGRGLIADPEWPRKALEGREDELRRCIMCNEYCVGNLLAGKPLGCVVNPRAGREKYYEVRRAETPRRVVVVGGGAAGMQAACTAAERGHTVVLFERSDRLGGQLLLASAPAFKRPLTYPLEYLRTRLEKLGVEVRLRTEATPQRIARESPDAVIVATGARPAGAAVPGADKRHVVSAWDIHRPRPGLEKSARFAAALGALGLGARGDGLTGGEGEAEGRPAPVEGDRVVVAGGGLVGCETALDLARHGKQVTVVETLPEAAGDLNPVNRTALLGLLAEAGVTVLTGHRITAVVDEGLKVAGPDGRERLVEADTVVLALGSEPEDELARELRREYARFFVVGDCAEPRRLGEAIHEGFAAGLQV
jgi:2,4-dienoyl-CoA reductase-like NADH-dependent reductase (Old Yellow Enzyme family)/thioredoxin reductase